MPSGRKGFGALLEYDSTGAGAWVAVANITKIRPFNVKADVIDVSCMTSTGGYREKIAGMLDAGEAQIDINYDDKDTSHQWLIGNNGVTTPFRITFPVKAPAAAQKVTFSGFVSNVPPELPFDNKMVATSTLTISGVLTFA